MDNNNEFSVLNMAAEYAGEQDIDVTDIFKQNPVSGNIAKEVLKEEPNVHPSGDIRKGKKPKWSPPPELTQGMPDLNTSPIIYTKDELLSTAKSGLKHIADDNAEEAAVMAMDDLSRKNANIERVKREMGISKLQIPEGPWHAKIFAAAGDTNYQRAIEGLREIMAECLEENPEYILELSNETTMGEATAKSRHGTQQINDIPDNVKIHNNTNPKTKVSPIEDQNKAIDLLNGPIKGGDGLTPSISDNNDVKDVKIVIDKSKTNEVTWDKDEIDKIRKARSIELNIIEDIPLKYSEVEELDNNAVDAVLSQYVRKVNDIVAPLPASKYRATFTGLNYTEILDLSHSQEMNSLDGERKKWSIAFDHIKNQSIGPWREYKYYIDPDTNKQIELSINAPDPVDTTRRRLNIIEISKFDDFLMKTSFMDLEFILWKILCATAMDKEIISIDCHGELNGSPCKKSYDWVYSPQELLVMESINPAVLEEMKDTATASSVDAIQKNYASSMLNKGQVVELNTSKFGIAFGHISAYEYLNEIYSEIRALENQTNPMLSQALSYSTLTVIKSFLIPKEDGTGYIRIKGAKNLIRIIQQLDEIDWQTISELVRIMLEPYQFQFSLRDIKCPQCKTKSNIDIDDITRLLFIVAQSLSSVQVVLKRM